MFTVQLDKVVPNPEQPRKEFDQSELDGLAQSIRENGILQPILVKKSSDGVYILCDGERRVRAAKQAGLDAIPAMVLESTDGSCELGLKALVANLQRKDLNPIEEAVAYQAILDERGISVRALSKMIGVYEARIFNMLALLKLDEPIQRMVASREFTYSPNMIRLILDIPSQERIVLCRKLVARGLGKNIKAVTRSANLVLNKINKVEKYSSSDAPSVEIAQEIAEESSSGKVDLPKWDILSQAGKVPGWPVVYKAALETCNACSLRPVASRDTCHSCAGVVLILRMIELGNREKAHRDARRVAQRLANGH